MGAGVLGSLDMGVADMCINMQFVGDMLSWRHHEYQQNEF
jgi:hypothetical protein